MNDFLYEKYDILSEYNAFNREFPSFLKENFNNRKIK